MTTQGRPRPVALVTGVGRRAGIGAAIAEQLARDGFDIGMTYWSAYDDRMDWGRDEDALGEITEALKGHGARVFAVEADLADPAAPAVVFDRIAEVLGGVRALVLSHCESVDMSILDATLEGFDRHFAVNTRASWLLIREFALRFDSLPGTGRIVALTSGAAVGNVAYGASKAALDRIVLAAARELASSGITSNAVDPGPTQTGWIDDGLREWILERTPLARLGMPQDAANLVSFLCSERGGWITGQVLYSNGGFSD